MCKKRAVSLAMNEHRIFRAFEFRFSGKEIFAQQQGTCGDAPSSVLITYALQSDSRKLLCNLQGTRGVACNE